MLEPAGAQRLASTAEPPSSKPGTQMVVLPSDLHAARAARSAVTTAMEAWGIDGEIVEDARLITSELVGNATVHGRGEVRLTLRMTQAGANRSVWVEVFDERPITPALMWAIAGYSAMATENGLPECGRGLALVRAVTGGRVYLVSCGRKGKAVRAELEHSPARNRE